MKKKILSGVFLVLFIFAFSTVAMAANLYVDDDEFADGVSCDSATPAYSTIQGAVTAASPTDTTYVCPGTYDEQVVINKALTLEGSGDSTIIKPSSDAKLTTILDGVWWGGGTKQIASIVLANANGGNVVIKNIKVDGGSVTAKPATADHVAGIFYRETGGRIESATVTDITVGTTGTAVRGFGIYLSAGTKTVTVEVTDSIIKNYDKNGIQTGGSKLTAKIYGNTITGRGPLPDGDEVQNGVLIAAGTTGTVNDNTISDMAYIPEDWWCAAILFYEGSGSAKRNIINDCQSGVVYQDGSGLAEDNTINGGTVGVLGLWAQYTKAGAWTSSFVDNTVSGIKDSISTSWWVNPDTGAIGAQSWNDGASVTINIDNNHITGSSTSADGIYIGDIDLYEGDILRSSPAGSITATITNNIISGWNHGIHLMSTIASATITGNTIKNNVATDSGIHIEAVVDATKVNVNHNKIMGNFDYGVFNANVGTLNAENNWWGSSTGPTHSSNPDGTGDRVSNNVGFDPWLVFALTLTSPESKAYYTKDILVSASTVAIADKIEYSDNGDAFRILCRNCDSYSREKSFGEGDHNFVVKATVGSETDSEAREFFVDSIKPKIIKILPENGAIIHGTEFYIKYTEANLISVSLYWKESTATGDYNKETLDGCVPGSYKECTTILDLNAYDGKQVKYYFEVKDQANTVTSDVRTIKIDSTKPVVTINSPIDPFYSDTRVLLDVNVTEIVKTLEYSVDEGNFLRLCKDCSGYKDEKTFSNGAHTLVVRAIDYAGNTGDSYVTFTIDSKAPKIIKQLPRDKKYTNGVFTVTYTEMNLVNVTLHYKGVDEITWKQTPPVTTCESGRNKECTVTADLSSYNGEQINYYFELNNHLMQTIGKTLTVSVDTTIPTFTIISPVAEGTHPTKVPIKITDINEAVKLEYSDNSGEFRTLCKSCTSYDSYRIFSVGSHSVVIRATDVAENVKDSLPMSFTVV